MQWQRDQHYHQEKYRQLVRQHQPFTFGTRAQHKWGDSLTVGVYTSGTLIPNTLGLALRGNVEHRQGSSVTSLSDSGTNARVPYLTKSDNYTVGGRLNYHTSDKNTLWIDGETSQQQYDNRDGQLGPVGTSS